jgi:predicted GIY-YIG superfamily endonuclease
MRKTPKRDPQQTTRVYNIPCECGRRYIGETSRPLTVRLREHKHNLKEGYLGKSKLAQPAFEEGDNVEWDEAEILEIENNNRYRKYKQSAHMACLFNPISQPSLDISPIWIPIVSKGIINSKRRSPS